jgi:ribosomal protein S27AE
MKLKTARQMLTDVSLHCPRCGARLGVNRHRNRFKLACGLCAAVADVSPRNIRKVHRRFTYLDSVIRRKRSSSMGTRLSQATLSNLYRLVRSILPGCRPETVVRLGGSL